MRRLLYIGTIALLLSACARRPVQIVSHCPQKTPKDIVAALAALVATEGMSVTLVNENVGVLQAATSPSYSAWTGLTTTNQWQFNVRGDTVYAYAKSLATSTNVFGATTGGAETPYDDDVHPDHKWYWNVRNGLQQFCGVQQLIFRQQ